MDNSDVAKVFRELGLLTEIENQKNAAFKARAYHRVADVIDGLSSGIEEIYTSQGLKGLLTIPFIGRDIAAKIEELLTAGSIGHLDELKRRIPVAIEELSAVEGLGPKTIKMLYEKLKIRNLNELEKAASEGKLRSIPGIGLRKEQVILQKIQFVKKTKGRILLGEIVPLVKDIESHLASAEGVKEVIVVGSVRRMKETVGNIDCVISGDPKRMRECVINIPEVEKTKDDNPDKITLHLKNGIIVNLFVVQEENFGSAAYYFTGSREHVQEVQKLANMKGLTLNEFGFFDQQGNHIAGRNEEEVYETLGLSWIPPEMRENKGEIELAKQKEIPTLVQYGSVKGDLQVHSDSTDGTLPIEQMALAAKVQFELDYIAVTDHTISLKVANGLDEHRLLEQKDRIAELNDRLDGFRILSGAEVNIMKDGSLDISNNVLDRLDIVGASIHSNFSLPVEVQTERLVSAAQNPSVDILFHPTGRLISRREGYPIDIESIINVAKDTGTVLEINAHYNRLDLKDDFVRMAVKNEVKLIIDTDAHHPSHFAFLMLGIGQARRGWARPSDILNTLSADELLKSLK